MGSALGALAANRVLWASVGAWVIAQVLKTLRALWLTRKLNLNYIVSSGGMPSSHSALVTGLATAVGRVDGLRSTSFALAAVLAGVVMYDAAGVRLAVSKQARILNIMVDDFFHERGLNEQRLHELIGHTPVQVFAGALVGIIFGILFTL
ncbi:MAG TPA: divergent PAP2 family protein [Ktedonobacterales bacterium]|jgi:acid phosphatase family membrane protein YuiD|nr:divergent PAP2 family protein [Ktedonobacterales bacterium]